MSETERLSPKTEQRVRYAKQWRGLTRLATIVCLLTAPGLFAYLSRVQHWSLLWSVIGTAAVVVSVRGFMDVAMRRLMPWPTLFGTDDQRLREEDIIGRRRIWFWRRKLRALVWLVGSLVIINTSLWWLLNHFSSHHTAWTGVPHVIGPIALAIAPQLILLGLLTAPLFFINIIIMFGPMVFFGIKQMQTFEPGDADLHVKLADVRGQKDAIDEIVKIVNIWQDGGDFVAAGGKRERGVLFLGAPGTGKTMMAKAIATGFNAPFVSMPGSGFQQAFMGTDILIARWMKYKATKLSKKWGGTCIIFIDEIDAIGMRRASLGSGFIQTPPLTPWVSNNQIYYGPHGSLTASGDLFLETEDWREWYFRQKAPMTSGGPMPDVLAAIYGRVHNMVMPGMMGMGSMVLNQILVMMDGIEDGRPMRRFITNRINTWLDAVYVIPTKLGKRSLRLPKPGPAPEQLYFIGATNVPLENLDPALTRAGRMGRHVRFRTPNLKDRLDIFDLYLGKVNHDEELDSEKARLELAKVTPGYSPADIQQVCSMALTYAQHDGRLSFNKQDLREARANLEAGVVDAVTYSEEEARAVAIHEAGHAVNAHVYIPSVETTRLSITKRGDSLGHHQAMPQEERFSSWRNDDVAQLAWTLGAMAAEHMVYDQNSRGVGGDVQQATHLAASMAGMWAMTPKPLPPLTGRKRSSWLTDREVYHRYEKIGRSIMNRASGGPLTGDPIGTVLGDPGKMRTAAQILGQAYLMAWQLVKANRSGIEAIAEELVERREIDGNDAMDLLDSQNLKAPEYDPRDPSVWPEIWMFDPFVEEKTPVSA